MNRDLIFLRMKLKYKYNVFKKIKVFCSYVKYYSEQYFEIVIVAPYILIQMFMFTN